MKYKRYYISCDWNFTHLGIKRKGEIKYHFLRTADRVIDVIKNLPTSEASVYISISFYDWLSLSPYSQTLWLEKADIERIKNGDVLNCRLMLEGIRETDA